MKKLLVCLFILFPLCCFSQERQNDTFRSFDAVSNPLTGAVYWYYSNKEWHMMRETCNYINRDIKNINIWRDFSGFKQINFTRYSNEGKYVYILRFKVGVFHYRYEYLEMDAFYTQRFIYFFLQDADVSKILTIKDSEATSILPIYRHEGYYNVSNNITKKERIKEEDRVINAYLNYLKMTDEEKHRRELSNNRDCDKIVPMLIKKTTSEGRPVVRFTLPYGNFTADVSDTIFESGPYYEVPSKQFEQFISFLKLK